MLKKIVCAAFLASAAFAAVPAFEEASAELAQSNYDNALRLFEKSCYEEKNAAGCYAAGFININNYSQNSSEDKSFEQFSKACDAGDMNGCKSLGDIYENGQAGQETDYKKAMKFYEKACEGKVGAACARVAGYYDEGRGEEQNLAKAFKFYETACKYEDASGCHALADIYEKGEGVKKTRQRRWIFTGWLVTTAIEGIAPSLENFIKTKNKEPLCLRKFILF